MAKKKNESATDHELKEDALSSIIKTGNGFDWGTNPHSGCLTF